MYLPSALRYPYDTSITPLKPVLHTVRYSASSFNLHCLFISLTSSSSCLCPLIRLPFPYTFTVVMCFRRQFLCKMCVCVCVCVCVRERERERKATPRRFTACRTFFFSLTVMLPHFSHSRSNLCPPFFSNTTLQNFPDTLDLPSEVFKFQYHTTFCFKM
jgi:hypothetical protein